MSFTRSPHSSDSDERQASPPSTIARARWRTHVAVLAGAATLLAACGGDAEPEATEATAAPATSDAITDDTVTDDDTDQTTPEPDTPVDELDVAVLASWDTEQPRIDALLVIDQLALVLERNGFDTTITAIDATTGEMRPGSTTEQITDIVGTATNGVFAFDFEACTFRPLDLDTLELAAGVGDLGTDGCSSSGDASMVRGDLIWHNQPGAVYVIDTSTNEVRSLVTTEISDRFAAGDRSSAALLDLGDAVLVTFFVSGADDLVALATRMDDDLTYGPLVEVPRRPYLDNGVLVDDSTTDDGFTEILVLDPITLEVTDAERPPVAPFGMVTCDVIDTFRAHPAPDGSWWWFGPVAIDDEVIMAQCRDGAEVARGVIDHDQFSASQATDDAFYYVATVRADPADDGTPSFDVVGEVLVRVGGG